MRVLIYCLLAVLLPVTKTTAQSPPAHIRALTIGDTMPDAILGSLLNHTTGTANLSDFKGRSVILDFWDTWCGSCIQGLPKLDLLQSQFSRDLVVIAVSRQPVETIQKFLAARSHKAPLRFIFAAGDSLLNQYFPHRLLPHQVWINNKGVVAAITAQGYATSENVSKLIAGKPLSLPVKRDLLHFNKQASFYENHLTDHAVGISVVTGYTEGLFTGFGRQVSSDSSHLRFYSVNQPIVGLYKTAFNIGYQVPVVLNVRDSARFFTGSLVANHPDRYCYELQVPASFPKERIQRIMVRDLDDYLGFTGRLEERDHLCYVLKKVRRKGSPAQGPSAEEKVKTYNAGQLINELQAYARKLPGYPVFIDESGLTGVFQLSRPDLDSHFIENVNNALRPNGLVLKKSRRKTTVLVISEPDYSLIPN